MWWLDGRLRDTSDMPFDLADRGLTLGDGVFDTSLVLNGAMVWRQAHLARLSEACDTLGFALDLGRADAAIEALTAGQASGALRITVTRGVGPRGLAPPEAAVPTLFASLAPPRTDLLFKPLSLRLSSIRRNETSPCSRLKTLDYLDAILASRAAIRAGFDDAVFLNHKGHIACTTTGNIVAISGPRLLTPPLSDGVLPGITRAALLQLSPHVGLEPVERSMILGDLERADAVYVVNSLKLMAPVTRLGSTMLGRSEAGQALATALKGDCGLTD